MKRLFPLFLSFALLCAFFCGALEVRLEPVRRNVTLGKFIQLQLSSDKKITAIDTPEIKGVRWENAYSSTGMQSINGKVTYTRTLMLVPSAEGVVTIPPFKVRAGSESAMTRELQVRVLPRSSSGGKEAQITDVVKGEVSFGGEKKSFYAGEEIVVNCDLLIDAEFTSQIRPSHFPELLNTGDALFSTFTYRNGRIRFQILPPEELLIKERPFIRHRFTALCRILIPGSFAPGASMRLGILQQSSSDEDDFFGGFGGSFFSSSRYAPYTLKFTPAPAAQIKALPPLPAGMLNTGLVGQWQISGALSSASLRQGEVAELILNFKGRGGADNFRPGELKFSGFRVYPPEVTKKENEITAKWALIPLEQGEKSLKICPAFFNTSQGKWEGKTLEFKAAVAPGSGTETAGVQKNFAPPAAGKGNAPGTAAASDGKGYLLYQKNAPGKSVKLPLMQNNFFWLILFAVGMPLAALLTEFIFRRREREESSPELQKKRELRKTAGLLAGELKRKGDTPEFRAKLIPLLGESLGLSAGASAGDIAREVKDPELCRYFAEVESASYMPGGSSETLLSAGGKKALLALLKKLSLLVLGGLFFLSAEAAELNAEFNRGNFAKAADNYLEQAVRGNSYRPAMLYNYGNCQYHLNNLPEARWALNLARLLAPGDNEIRTNLELVNAQLFTPEEQGGSFSSALAEMRDRIRCDHYFLFAAFCWGMLWILWSLRRKMGTSVFLGCFGAVLCLCLLSLASGISQMKGIYSSSRIIVTARSAELRTLPGRNSGAAESTVPGGSEGELIQQDNSGYSRVRINGREGWISQKSYRAAFPGKIW